MDQDEFLAKIRKIVIIWASFTDRELSGCFGLSVDDEEYTLSQKAMRKDDELLLSDFPNINIIICI